MSKPTDEEVQAAFNLWFKERSPLLFGLRAAPWEIVRIWALGYKAAKAEGRADINRKRRERYQRVHPAAQPRSKPS